MGKLCIEILHLYMQVRIRKVQRKKIALTAC